jgi:Uma2 family endonuclease
MTVLQELAENPKLAYRLTVSDYETMLEKGVIEEGAPFELLDGQIVPKIRNASGEGQMTIGTKHMTVVSRLADLNPKLKRLGCCMRAQGPLKLSSHDMPEPDGAIVKGTQDDYIVEHPNAQDTICVIEVADASLRRDRGSKLQLYARSRIATYVIVNLVERVVEVYKNPVGSRYDPPKLLKLRDSLSLPTATQRTLDVPCRRLLP